MPFTLSHPAIVVPLARRFPHRLVLPALVIGSMSPDFEYFVYLRTVRTISHDLVGVILMCIPSGLVVLWLFEHLAKKPLVLLLPRSLRQRLLPHCEPVRFRPAGRFLAIVASLTIGAFSHIAWDSLTHANGWIVQRVPALSTPFGQGLAVYILLQHTSTFIGLVLIVTWVRGWLLQQQPVRENGPYPLSETWRVTALSVLIIVPALSGLSLMLLMRDSPSDHRPYTLVVRFILGYISTFFFAALAYCSTFKIVRGRAIATSVVEEDVAACNLDAVSIVAKGVVDVAPHHAAGD